MKRKPFLKWAGNKLPIIDRIKAVLPKGERLVEPFCGSGAVFLNTDYPSYLLADANEPLIALYRSIFDADFESRVLDLFQPENNTADRYYEIRGEFNNATITTERAAMFLYLNRHGFNGLCRFNKKGLYNVPFGRYASPYKPLKELDDFRQKVAQSEVEFLHTDYADVMSWMCERGDVVYADPPYAPYSETSDFANYTGNGFGDKEQRDLAKYAEYLQLNGIPVVISNHDTPYTRQLYKNASKIESFEVQRTIAAKGSCRKKVKELLACYYP